MQTERSRNPSARARSKRWDLHCHGRHRDVSCMEHALPVFWNLTFDNAVFDVIFILFLANIVSKSPFFPFLLPLPFVLSIRSFRFWPNNKSRMYLLENTGGYYFSNFSSFLYSSYSTNSSSSSRGFRENKWATRRRFHSHILRREM